jgi:hypothetical protein
VRAAPAHRAIFGEFEKTEELRRRKMTRNEKREVIAIAASQKGLLWFAKTSRAGRIISSEASESLVAPLLTVSMVASTFL